MTAIRYSLLADQRDDADYIKRCILTAVLCFLLSLVAHLLFFTVWQLVDNDPADKFHFSLLGENVPIELVLTFGETEGEAASIAQDQSADGGLPPASSGGLFSPTENFADNGWSHDFLQALDNLGLDEGFAGDLPPDALDAPHPTGIQNAIPPSLVDQALAQAELITAAGDSDQEDLNPDPPISLEHQAPPYKSYFTTVSSAIRKLWILPPLAKTQFRPGRLTILFTISRDGELLRWVVQESSGNATLDHAGQEALRSAAPFPPFPPELSHREQLDIIMHFDYKATYKRAGGN